MDALSYWQLRERPFEAVWSVRFFFRSHAHEEALHRLFYLAAEQTMNAALLTGETGCGKTLTCAALRELLDPAQYCVASLEHAQGGFGEIAQRVLRAAGSSSADDPPRTGLWALLATELGRVADRGQHLVVMLDEAQDYDSATLREIRSLTTLNGNGRALLTLMLCGQPELQARLTETPSLAQRIGLQFHLRSLTRGESDAYLAHRLRVAGHGTGELFAEPAREALFEMTSGVPRELNRLAKLALEHAWLAEDGAVGLRSLEAIAADEARHRVGGAW